jgi:hypothetical protein
MTTLLQASNENTICQLLTNLLIFKRFSYHELYHMNHAITVLRNKANFSLMIIIHW